MAGLTAPGTAANDSIDDLLRDPGFAVYAGAAYRGIVDIVLDGEKLRKVGVRIGDLPLDFGLTEDLENGPQEIVAVANVLASQGYPKATLVKRDRPDFAVTMPDGPLYIEHTRALTGYQRGSEELLFEGVHALRSDPSFLATIGRLTVSVTVDRSPVERTPMEVLQNPEPDGFIANLDASRIVAEIRTLAGRGYFAQLVGRGRQPVPAGDAPTLAKFRATVDVDQAVADDMLGVHMGVTMWKPGRLSLFQACVQSIADKTRKAAKYPVPPDWLVIQAVAPPDVFAYDLADNEITTLGPFTTVFVLSPHVDGRLYVAAWTRRPDGTIAAEVPELPDIEMPYDEALHEWAAAVELALEPRRNRARLAAGTDADVPKMTSDPMQVQWYRRWLGPHPWVLCQSSGDRILMCFWMADNWAARRIETISPDEVDGAAGRIWDFIAASPDAASKA